jgi:hypothetical protein
MSLRAGAEVDGWQLIELLGRGGNGEVWRAEHPQWGEAALKLLRRRGLERLQRFRDEVAVMRSLGEHPGVLPLVAAELPEPGRRRRAWLASPVAVPVAAALGEEPSVTEVVAAIETFALTLAELAERGIGHRDVKPDNLFRYDKRWAIGDFGLADYPGKEAITAPGRRLGPLYFIAPEMLREPDLAEAEPADVYSLTKTLWALASGRRYPPEGQIRADLPDHDLATWTQARGTLALGLLLEAATELEPAARPSMAEFASQLAAWQKGGVRQDESAAAQIRRRYVERLGDSLAQSLDKGAFGEVEREFETAFAEARKRSQERQREVQVEAFNAAEEKRVLLTHKGVKAVMNVVESVWVGSLRDGHDFAAAVLAQPTAARAGELETARRIILGRPLWWLHSVLFAGCLNLRGQAGCEPLASELSTEGLRNHLLAFPDQRVSAAAWRLQRSLIPAVARILSVAPLQQLSDRAKSVLPAEEQIRFNVEPSRIFVVGVSEAVRMRLRSLPNWTAEGLDVAAVDAESMLSRLPIPAGPWPGPVGDPWLQSWERISPLLMCGLTILNEDAAGDELLGEEERAAIFAAATGDYELLRRPAVPLATRLGLIAPQEQKANG